MNANELCILFSTSSRHFRSSINTFLQTNSRISYCYKFLYIKSYLMPILKVTLERFDKWQPCFVYNLVCNNFDTNSNISFPFFALDVLVYNNFGHTNILVYNNFATTCETMWIIYSLTNGSPASFHGYTCIIV